MPAGNDGTSKRTPSILNALVIGLIAAVGVAAGACGKATNTEEARSPVRGQDPACVPDDVVGLPRANPDRRIEDIVETMTGERQTGDSRPD
jgi:hypothetical protein